MRSVTPVPYDERRYIQVLSELIKRLIGLKIIQSYLSLLVTEREHSCTHHAKPVESVLLNRADKILIESF